MNVQDPRAMQGLRSTASCNRTVSPRSTRLALVLLLISAILFLAAFMHMASVATLAAVPPTFSAGDANSLVAAPLATVGPGIYEDTNENVLFSTGWTRVANASASGGTFTRSNTVYAIGRIYVQGASSFRVMTAKGPNRGIVKILIDGRDVAHWDQYSQTVQYRVLSPVYALPDFNTHWIGIQVSGTRNTASTGIFAFLDQFVVKGAAATATSTRTITPGTLPTQTSTATTTQTRTSSPTATHTNSPTPTSSPTATNSPTATPTRSPTATATPSVTGTHYEDDDPSLVYENTWTRYTDSNASAGHYTRSDVTYAIARLYVSGATSFQFRTITGPDRGIVKVLIDNKDTGRFDTYNATTVYGVLSPVYMLPDANQHSIAIQAGDSRNAASIGFTAVLDEFIVNGGSVVPTNTPTATSTSQPTNTPTPTSPGQPTNTRTPTLPPSSTHLRRANMPYFGASSVAYPQTAVFWLGQVNENTQYGDIRVGYNDSEIYINANVMDAYLWYDPNTPTASNLTQYDSVSVFLSRNGTSVSQPDSSTYRFDAEFTWWEPDRTRWQAAYQGNGSSWTLISYPFLTEAGWRGDQPNNTGLDRGWSVTYHIPYTMLGVSAPPAPGTRWGIAVALHNRNDAAGTLIADQVWPENMNNTNPTTWGELQFGLAPAFTAPPAVNITTATIKNHLNGQVATTTNVGGYTLCGENIGNYGLAYWQQWGIQNWAGKEYLNVMNQVDIADWACFNKVYALFPLDTIPAGKVITSAQLTMYQFGHAGNPGQYPGPSLIQVFGVDTAWDPNTINFNNAPWPTQNLDRQWAGLGGCPNYTNCPAVTWDVSQLVTDAYQAGLPLRFILYDSDDQISSGKYFFASETGDWNAVNRPVLSVTYGDPH